MISKNLFSWVPDRVGMGSAKRRLRKAIRKPLTVLKNAKFFLGNDVSCEFHIFVLGPPRSGTTLIKNVVRSHSEVCGVDDETHFFIRKNYVEFRSPGVPDSKMKRVIEESSSIPDLFDGFAKARKRETGKPIFLEKTTIHALRTKYILEHFPKSKLVFVVRDPRDCFRSAKNNPNVWEGLPSDDRLGAYMETWKRCVWGYLDYESHGRICLVQYEDFCRAPTKELSRVMDFLSLDMEERQLDPSIYSRTEVSERQGLKRLQDTVSPKTVGKWRKTLDDREVARIEQLVGDEMKDLGYNPVIDQ